MAIKHKKLRELYNYGKPLARINYARGVLAVSPNYCDVLRVCRFVNHCDLHQSTMLGHVAFTKVVGYTEVFGPGVYLGTIGDHTSCVIFGDMNRETEAALVAEVGDEIKLNCGCTLSRIPDEEVLAIIEGKEWVCAYISGHLVDER